MKTIVVLPAYNAAKTVAGVVGQIPETVSEIILVDDASSDRTVEVARSLPVTVVAHPVNKGYGANQKTCYNLALEHNADAVIMLHPDGQHDPLALSDFIKLLSEESYSAVYGSRMYSLKNNDAKAPWWRYLSNIALSFFANRLLGASLTDWHTGYRGYTKSLLQSIDYNNFPDGFEFDTHMTTSIVKKGIKIKELYVPAIYSSDSSSISFIRSVKYGFNFVFNVIRKS